MRAWTPNISACWLTMWMANMPLATPTCSLQPRSWKDGQKARDPLLLKTITIGGSNVTQPQASGNLFPCRKLKGNHTFMAQCSKWKALELKWTQCKARRGRRGWVFRGGRPRYLKLDWWSRSAGQLYHLFCQCSWAVPEEKPKLFQLWQSWPSCERLSEGSQQDHQKNEFKCKRRMWRREAGPHRNQQSLNWHPWIRLPEPEDIPNFPSWTLIHLIGGVDYRT